MYISIQIISDIFDNIYIFDRVWRENMKRVRWYPIWLYSAWYMLSFDLGAVMEPPAMILMVCVVFSLCSTVVLIFLSSLYLGWREINAVWSATAVLVLLADGLNSTFLVKDLKQLLLLLLHFSCFFFQHPSLQLSGLINIHKGRCPFWGKIPSIGLTIHGRWCCWQRDAQAL